MAGVHEPMRRLLPICLSLLVVMAVAGPGVAQRPAASRRERAAAARVPTLPEAVRTARSRPPLDVPPVDRTARESIRTAATAIDRIVTASWQTHGIEPAPPLTDEQFLRRVYLDLAGRIPTHDEAAAFLAAEGADARDELVERLLSSADYVSRFYNVWADVLRLAERPQRQLFLEPYLHFVKDAIRTNKPYDQWVHEMLTADGRLWDNPAVGYQLRDAGMPLPYVDNTVRIFLGTQIGCAQCHDHPFDDWTQRQFYELAALTAGTSLRRGGGQPAAEGKPRFPVDPAVRRLVRQARSQLEPGETARTVNFIQANAFLVDHRDRPLTLPHDYQYDDAEPGTVVAPQVLWGEVPTEAHAADGRERFAAWIVSRDNRQFARTIANRLWKTLLGVGLVEPIDDFRGSNPASNPELLEHLADEMMRLDFDLREFVRLVVSTDVYRRRAVAYDPVTDGAFRFPGPALRRLTAEQLWDSILTLLARATWAVQRPTAEAFSTAAAVNLDRASFADVQRQLDIFGDRYGPGRYQRSLQEVCGFGGQLLVRASELPSPLPLSHFLRQFGQGDRETIDGGRTVATIPQILEMFNGPITHLMLLPGSVIYDEVVSHPAAEAVDVVFLAVLSRRPSADDRSIAMREIATADSPATGCGNVIWALLNTREFLFIQ